MGRGVPPVLASGDESEARAGDGLVQVAGVDGREVAIPFAPEHEGRAADRRVQLGQAAGSSGGTEAGTRPRVVA